MLTDPHEVQKRSKFTRKVHMLTPRNRSEFTRELS